MRILAIAAVAASLALSGCGQWQRQQAHFFGHTNVCVDGVTYIQFPTGTVEKHDRQGHIVPCGL